MSNTAKAARRRLSMKHKRYMAGVLFTLPAIIGIVWLFLWPVLQSFLMSLSSVAFDTAAGKSINTFIGLRNYITALLEDANFNKYLVSSLQQMAVNVPIIVLFSFFAATLIHEKFPGRGVARFLFFLPLVLSSAAVMTLDSADLFQQSMANSDFKSIDTGSGFLQGVELARLLEYTGLPESLSNVILSGVNSVFKIISLSGVQIIVLLAALQSVSPSLYEMAKVEGATSWEIFWKITFVLISPMLLLCTIYSIVDSFTAYNNQVILAVKEQMYGMGNYGLASAMSWIYFAIVTVIQAIVAVVGSKMVFYYDA